MTNDKRRTSSYHNLRLALFVKKPAPLGFRSSSKACRRKVHLRRFATETVRNMYGWNVMQPSAIGTDMWDKRMASTSKINMI